MDQSPGYFARVFSNDNFRRGVAGAVGAVLVAAISEVLFPSNS
jgi:hypothetical protein